MNSLHLLRTFIARLILVIIALGCAVFGTMIKTGDVSIPDIAQESNVIIASGRKYPPRIIEPNVTYIEEESNTVQQSRTRLGTFRVTAYCSCYVCCGEWALNRPNGIVVGAAGTELIQGSSCASTLPFGSKIEIDGLGTYVVQDRLANWVVEKYGENVVDIYFDDHLAASMFGEKYLDVFLYEEE